MSYIRDGSEFIFVDTYKKSGDYVYPASTKEGKRFIEDYGGVSDMGLVELFGRLMKQCDVDEVYRDYLLQKLSNKLNVKIKKEFIKQEE